jgi:hypothetical protein
MRDRGSIAANVLATIGVIIVIVLVVVGGYLGGWWLKEDATNRTSRINQDSYGRQNGLVEAVLDDYREASDPALPNAQRQAIIIQLCDNASKLTGSIELPFTVQTFIDTECF